MLLLVCSSAGKEVTIKISMEKVYGGEGVPTVAVDSDKLCDDWNAIGMRHGHWMDCQN